MGIFNLLKAKWDDRIYKTVERNWVIKFRKYKWPKDNWDRVDIYCNNKTVSKVVKKIMNRDFYDIVLIEEDHTI